MCKKKIRCPEYDPKLNLLARFQYWKSGEYEVLFHSHYA